MNLEPSSENAATAHSNAPVGRIRSRPSSIIAAAETGLLPFELSEGKGLLYVPARYGAATAAPLTVALHGAGGDARNALQPLRHLADERGFIILAPSSVGSTWDLMHGGYGPDVALISSALDWLFANYAIDPQRIALQGFSDGASYALSLGLGNGDLFTHLIGFSPGFIAPTDLVGSPRIYISHGEMDRVLPIGICGRRIATNIERAGYDLRFVEFDGGHLIPREIAEDAVDWMIGDQEE